MIEAYIGLFGQIVQINYQMHEDYIEWNVPNIYEKGNGTIPIFGLLNTILKAAYPNYVENKLREHYYWHMEEQARAHPPDDVVF